MNVDICQDIKGGFEYSKCALMEHFLEGNGKTKKNSASECSGGPCNIAPHSVNQLPLVFIYWMKIMTREL